MLKNLLVLVVLLCFANSITWSQTATPATSTAAASAPSANTMPTDPAELMKLAAEVNGLHSDKLAPWHLKLSFQLYDFKGKPTEKGTFEEFWITPKKYKVIYTSKSFNQTEWGTEDGGFFLPVGSSVRRDLQFLIRSRMLNPLEFVEHGTLTTRHEMMGNVYVNCVLVSPVPTKRTAVESLPSGTYCFSQNEPILRTVSVAGTTSISNRIIRFQNHYLPKSLQVTDYKRPYLDLQLESIESLNSIDQRDFIPPADAEKEDRPVQSGIAGITLGRVLSSPRPDFPVLAMEHGVEGIVVVHVTVGKDGRVLDQYVTSTPDAILVRPALDAVKDYLFSPFVLNGEPVEVEVFVEINFHI